MTSFSLYTVFLRLAGGAALAAFEGPAVAFVGAGMPLGAEFAGCGRAAPGPEVYGRLLAFNTMAAAVLAAPSAAPCVTAREGPARGCTTAARPASALAAVALLGPACAGAFATGCPSSSAEILAWSSPSTTLTTAGSALMLLSMPRPFFWCSTHRAGPIRAFAFVTFAPCYQFPAPTCSNLRITYRQPLRCASDHSVGRQQAGVQVEVLLEVAPLRSPDPLPLPPFNSFRRQELTDGRAHFAAARPLAEGL